MIKVYCRLSKDSFARVKSRELYLVWMPFYRYPWRHSVNEIILDKTLPDEE